MKILATGFIVSAIACSALAPRAAFAATTLAVSQPSQAPQAPLDHYFGKLGMSPIGVVNAIKLVNTREDLGLADPLGVLNGMAMVEDAVKDWETQYPGDIWLPRVVMSIERVYRKIDDDRARAAALRVDSWLMNKYPQSDEADSVIAETTVDPTPAVLRP